MEVKLDKLIETIKKEGVQEAKKESEVILSEARKKAENMVKEAERESSRLKDLAKRDSEAYEQSAQASIKQSLRDAVLVLKEKIINIFDGLLKKEISDNMPADYTKDLILKLVDRWSLDKEVPLEVLVSEKDREGLYQVMLKYFKSHFAGRVEIKIHPSVKSGFRIGLQGENIYYDFTEQSIKEVLSYFLNSKLKELMQDV